MLQLGYRETTLEDAVATYKPEQVEVRATPMGQIRKGMGQEP